MLKISIKVALRHLLREKLFTLMNLFGLAIALAASLFILQFVFTEYSYDREIPAHDRKYRLTLTVNESGDQQTYATNYYPVAPAIVSSIPEVVDFNRFYYLDRHAIVTIGNEKYNEMNVLFADANFLNFFGYAIEKNSSGQASSNGAFLSQRMATKYFGDASPLDQLIKVNTEDGEHLFKVSGVFDEPEGLSHFNPKIVLPISRLTSTSLYQKYNWTWNFFGTYIQLKDGAKSEVVKAKINRLLKGLLPDRLSEKEVFVDLQPVSDIHLNPNLTYEYAIVGSGLITRYLLYAVVFILVLAYVNYINITNARNSLRIKEIGINKVLGSGKLQIGIQLLLESFIMNLAAIILSLTLIQILVPVLKAFEVSLEFDLFVSVYYLPGLFVLMLLGTAATGLLPSWLMSNIKANEAITKSSGSNKSGLGLRRIMVLSQFAITMVMIASVMIMRTQLDFMINKDKGLDLEQVVVVNGPRASKAMLDSENYQGLINELNLIPGVSDASASTSVPGIWMGNSSMSNNAGSQNEIPVQSYRANSSYFDCYGIDLETGRLFTDKPADKESIVINESAFLKLGYKRYEEALNQKIKVAGRDKRIVGIVADYHHFNLKEPVYPTIFLPFRNSPEYFSFKLASKENQTEVLSKAEAVWSQFYPSDPFDYFYQGNLFERAHSFETQVVQIFSLFTFLAIFIACLGLVGLATFITNRRIKEIGIRKVLGATLHSLLYLLVKDFLTLILFGLILAIPFVYFGMMTWLDNYAYRIDFPWWVIPVAGTSLILITLVVVAYQTLKTAMANPVEALKCE